MVRVDHGTEHSLMLFVQDYLRDQRGNLSCEPYIQTRSREVSCGFEKAKDPTRSYSLEDYKQTHIGQSLPASPGFAHLVTLPHTQSRPFPGEQTVKQSEGDARRGYG